MLNELIMKKYLEFAQEWKLVMVTLINTILKGEGYQLLRNESNEYDVYVKGIEENKLQAFVVWDIENVSMDKNRTNETLHFVKEQLLEAGKEVDIITIFSTNDISQGAALCDELNCNDRYIFNKEEGKILLLEYQKSPMNKEWTMLNTYLENGYNVYEGDGKAFLGILKDGYVSISLVIICIIVHAFIFINRDLSEVLYIYEKWSLSWMSIFNDKEYYRFITSFFMHADIDHLMSNMVSLLFIGIYTEKRIGKIKYLLVYFTSGIIAGITSVLYNMFINEYVSCVGASGAIFGVTGAALGYVMVNISKRGKSEFIRLGLYVLFVLISGFRTPEVDNAAHVGGLIIGLITFLVLYTASKEKKE
jgi:rhomboid protease GluP